MPTKDRKAQEANSIFFLAVCGFLSPILTFAIAMTSLSAQTKISALAFVATAYASLFYVFYRRGFRYREPFAEDTSANIEHNSHEPRPSIESADGSEDTFHSVVRDLREKIPFENAMLFEVVSSGELRLVVEDMPGGFETGRGDLGLYRMAALSGDVETELDQIAIPLTHDGRIFGVLGVELSRHVDVRDVEYLAAKHDEMAPKFAAAFAYDRRVSAALTDPVTGLPNERAFLMVLEHQLAESLRHRDERPLSVIAIDICGFSKLNEEFGHAIGDRILRFAAETMKEHFRAMDFVARTRDDEFLVVVPLADESTTSEIVFRLSKVLSERTFEFDDEHSVSIIANFGIASFWKDGESTQQLIQNAQFRKQQAKAEDSIGANAPKKEYVH